MEHLKTPFFSSSRICAAPSLCLPPSYLCSSGLPSDRWRAESLGTSTRAILRGWHSETMESDYLATSVYRSEPAPSGSSSLNLRPQ